VVTCLFWCAPLFAQPQAPETPAAPANDVAAEALINRLKSESGSIEWVSANHVRFKGGVEQEIADDTRLFADDVEWFIDTNRLVASGNVVFAGPEGRIAASRVEFNTVEGTGTFHEASGLMSLGSKADRSQFGGQDPDVYFWGNTIEKVGPRRYRITRGGFTTCVQPTPRWELVTGSMVLNLNDYAIARNTLLRVKGVPVMYLPVIYYPIKDDDRATGFLLPTYGTSTLRGQAVSNAFFWAINRSQDATFAHDWFTRSGQGLGTEYRYVAGPQSEGNARFYRFSQKEAEYSTNGVKTVLPENNSIELTGTATHAFTRTIRGRARLDYFSSIVNQQLYHQNIYMATRRNRLIEGGITAALGVLSTSVLYQRNEIFNNATDTQVIGSTPRISASVAPQRFFRSPVYGSVNAEYAYLPYRSLRSAVVESDSSLSRFDVSPTVRAPLSRLTYLSVNTSAIYRTTYYSRSAVRSSQNTESAAYLRQYAGFRADVVGPVFTRIWDLADDSFADRLKHVIEPSVSGDFTSPISSYQRAPVLSDASDFVVSGSSRITYGLTNRLFYRGHPVDGQRGQTREFVTVGLQQTYYSNSESSQYDNTYQSAYGYRRRLDLSPLALTVRVSPSSGFDGNGRVEYDVSGRGLQVLSAGPRLSSARGSTSINYSRRRIDSSRPADDYVTTNTSWRWLEGRVAGSYALSWDIGRAYIQSQSAQATYLAQCCGLMMEFQKFNYAELSGIPIPADTRFNFGFVLAGLGTFSNFFGAFGGQR
jgi:LPS-assembly protein